MPLNQNVTYRVNDIEKGRRDVTKNSEKTEQEHKGIDTRDIDSSPRRWSKSCVEIRLWCLRLCRAKKRYSDRVLIKPTRRILERIKTRSKECKKPDDTMAVAGVSTMPHRESISHRDAPKKSRRSRKEDEAVEVDKDVSRAERKRRKREEKKRKVMTEEEREKNRKVMTEEEREKRESVNAREERRRKREEHIPYLVDTRLVMRDDDLAVEDRVPAKPPSIADLPKSCCYLCVQNTLAIAAASRLEQSNKCVQVSPHKFHAETSSKRDKSCSPVLLVRTVQSSVKVKTRETSTLCPGTSMVPLLHGETGPRTKKRKKFVVFPGLTRTKCPAGRHAACETDKSARRDDNAKKPELRCCKEKNV